MKNKNPHDLCTWKDEVECSGCESGQSLHCRWDRKLLMAFVFHYLPFAFTSWFGLVMFFKITHLTWPLVVNGVFYIFFFGFFEIRILCSHCPYYGEEGLVLHCLANHGLLKFWSYHPEPMNSFEKISLVVCFLFLGLFPVIVQAYGIRFVLSNYEQYSHLEVFGIIGMASATLLTITGFFFALRSYVCTECINFSCPLNTVPEPVVNGYLERNRVMREAWEKSGYKKQDISGS